jgi:hypothetical protein
MRPLIFSLLLAKMPYPHHTLAPSRPSIRLFDQPQERFRAAILPSEPARHLTSLRKREPRSRSRRAALWRPFLIIATKLTPNYRDETDAERRQVLVHLGVPVAPVGGDRSRWPADEPLYPPCGWGEQRPSARLPMCRLWSTTPPCPKPRRQHCGGHVWRCGRPPVLPPSWLRRCRPFRQWPPLPLPSQCRCGASAKPRCREHGGA